MMDKEHKAKITNGFTIGFTAVIGGIIGMAAIVFIFSLFSSKYFVKPDDVRVACIEHHAVKSVRSIEWSIGQRGTVGILCNDGYYTTR